MPVRSCFYPTVQLPALSELSLTYRALLFTVDSNVGDFRQSVEKMKGTTGDAKPGRKMGPFTDHSHSPHDASLNWKDVAWLREVAGDVPVYLKGVSSVEVCPFHTFLSPASTSRSSFEQPVVSRAPDSPVQQQIRAEAMSNLSAEKDVLTTQDLKLAHAAGVKGCILSNHGGRQLDRARSGFDSLRQIRQQAPEVLQQLEVYVDGGARRGTDVLMALALGAKGVGLGRPFLNAQAAYGEKGAIRAVRSESCSFYLWVS